MKPYTKTYLAFFGYTIACWIQCEIPGCGQRAVDIHHINARSLSQHLLNAIGNLMALCRQCHATYGDKKQHKDYLQTIHDAHISARDSQTLKNNKAIC